jgi:hypothetical protein
VTVQIINFGEFDPSWNWLAHRFASDNLVWKAYTIQVKTSSECLARPATSQTLNLPFSSNFTDLPHRRAKIVAKKVP